MSEFRAPTLGETGEFALLDRIAAQHAPAAHVLVGIGDDAAVLTAPSGSTLVCVDLLIEGRHFRRDWSSALDIGRRSAAASLADIAAMGGAATALVIGFAAPTDLPTHWALEFDAGLREEAALVGAAIVGGDISVADAIMISVTAIGGVAKPVLRSGAHPGDRIAIAGRLGHAAAGLAILQRGFRAPKALVDAYRVPHPPYEHGVLAGRAGASAMIDVSDGLIADARHIAHASAVVMDLDRALIPVDSVLTETAAAYTMDPLEWVLTGGDDHALLATFPAKTKIPAGFTVIGVVTEGDEPGVCLNGTPISARGGHEHFRRE
jgi:thiamine-monophosphate kinase